MRFLLATCLYLGTALATSNYFVIKSIRDYVHLETLSGIVPGTSLKIIDPNIGNSIDCTISLLGVYYENARPNNRSI